MKTASGSGAASRRRTERALLLMSTWLVCLENTWGCGFSEKLISLRGGSDGARSGGAQGDGGAGALGGEGGTSETTSGGAGGATSPPLGRVLAIIGRQYGFCARYDRGFACWGRNDEGQFGTGTRENALHPTRIAYSDGVRSLALGASHACAAFEDGLRCSGSNEVGQLGIPTSIGETIFTKVPAVAPGDVFSGFAHSCVISSSKTLTCFGENTEGQLGLGPADDTAPVPSPTSVQTGKTFDSMGLGDGHSCAIQSDGTLWCWGRNTQKQLGLGAAAAGQVRIPTKVGVRTDWAQVSASLISTCALTKGGELYCFGKNDHGQLGLDGVSVANVPTLVPGSGKYTSLAHGVFHSCVLDDAGSLYCAGRRYEGQLGAIASTPFKSLTQIGATLGPFDAVAVSRFSTCVLRREDGKIYCTGRNGDGELGIGMLTPAEAVEFAPISSPK